MNIMSLSDSYRKILVAIDGSKASSYAAEHAINLAQRYKASLIILHVLHLKTLRQISSSFITAPTFGLEEAKELKARAKKWTENINKKLRPMAWFRKQKSLRRQHQLWVLL